MVFSVRCSKSWSSGIVAAALAAPVLSTLVSSSVVIPSILLSSLVVTPALAANPLPHEAGIAPNIDVDNPPILPLKDVKAGMKGKGYTVFASERGPEEFGFVILGVMKSYLGPGEDLIIARLVGPQIEKTGVIAGMSGSPAYIDGKLIGAVGYRFGNFTDEPIAGITPIERMMTSADAPKNLDFRVPPVFGDTVGSLQPNPQPSLQPNSAQAYGPAMPIATPILGVSPEIASLFADEFRKRGYQSMIEGTAFSSGSMGMGGMGMGTTASSAAAGVGSAGMIKPLTDNAKRFYAGGPIAGMMVTGDINMAGIGTVTWVKGDRFLAFGHPFLETGISDMPVGNADIVLTVAAKSGSWKMGQAVSINGHLTDDRLHAIAGTMGEAPTTIPMRVRLNLQSGPRADKNALQEFNVRLSRHPRDTPMYAAMALAGALSNRAGAEQFGSYTLTGKVTLSTGDVLTLKQQASSDGGDGWRNLVIGMLMDLSSVTDQEFRLVEIKDIEVNVEETPEVHLSRIVSVEPIGPLVAGEDAKVRLRVQSYLGGIEEKTISMRIPRNISSGGPVALIAASSASASRIEREGGLIPQPLSFAGLLDARKRLPPIGTISLYLVGERLYPRIEGFAVPDLPPTLSTLASGGSGLAGSPVDLQAVFLTRIEVPTVLFGEMRTKVEIIER